MKYNDVFDAYGNYNFPFEKKGYNIFTSDMSDILYNYMCIEILQERLCLSFLRELIERKNRRKMENNILRIFM